MKLWESSQDAWIQKYIYGEEFVSRNMDYGKKIAEGLETGETKDPEIEYLRTFLPDYPFAEYELNIHYKKIPLVGRLDKFDPDNGRIGEIKTGLAPWTQTKVDRDGQLTWYAWMYFLIKREMPRDIALYWARTEWDEERQLHLTGEIKTFHTERGLIEFAAMAERAQAAWEGIIKVTSQHYSQIA